MALKVIFAYLLEHQSVTPRSFSILYDEKFDKNSDTPHQICRRMRMK